MDMNFQVNMNEYLPLRDVVFNTLRQAILRGELKPGERLMEIQLANKLGVSRTPIREAIRKLELEGLVLMIPRKGAEVAEITEKNMQDVLEVTSRASIRAMVNRAVVVGRNGNRLASAENAGEITAYGRFQQVLGKDGDPAEQAKAAMQGRVLSARVTLMGNLAYRCGGTVRVDRPQWGLEGAYAVTAHEHRWEKGLFTTSLSLEAIQA